MTNKVGKPLKSLVLAAGHGTRLRPLTNIIPKPLATVCGVALLEAALFRVKQAGATAVAVNTHHLHDVMAAKLSEICGHLNLKEVFVSHERDEILGTGGALLPIRSWWGDDRLLVYNGDILSNMALDRLAVSHEESKPLVTMAVRPIPPKDGGRSVWVDPSGYVRAICHRQDLSTFLQRSIGGPPSADHELRELGFACAYVAEPGLREFLPAKTQFYDLISAFQAALSSGQKILGVNYDCFWADVGTPLALWKTNLDVAAMGSQERQMLLGRDLAPSLFTSGPQNVVSPLAIVHRDARLIKTVLLDGADVAEKESLVNHIRGFGLNHAFDLSV